MWIQQHLDMQLMRSLTDRNRRVADSEVDSISTNEDTVGIEQEREYIVFPVSFEKPDTQLDTSRPHSKE